MNNYITGTAIKLLREKKHMTQAELAAAIQVSDKTVSKWETAKGLPDITLIEPLAAALGTSVIELMSGEHIVNENVSCNMLRSKFYVCPICGNVLCTTGNALISCCGVTLPAMEAEDTDDSHHICIEPVEDEHYIYVRHDMTKEHFISFAAFVTTDRVQLIKFYPEGNAEARLSLRGNGFLYICCNRHGLMKQRIRP